MGADARTLLLLSLCSFPIFFLSPALCILRNACLPTTQPSSSKPFLVDESRASSHLLSPLNTASFLLSLLLSLTLALLLSAPLQLNQNSAVSTPKIPWVLTKEEKKNYDQIFRAWDQSGSGFLSGDVAQEVFGQSGLNRDDMAKIW